MEKEAAAKSNAHRPYHLYEGHTYFVTGRCVGGKVFFKSDEQKILFREVLKQSIDRFCIRLYAWVVLDNHYHVLFSLPDEVLHEYFRNSELSSREIRARSAHANFTTVQFANPFNLTYDPKHVIVEFVRKLHKDTARILNIYDNTSGRKVWYQYWDYCIRNKADFWRHFNYIVQNPLKHGITKTLYEAFNFTHSSNPVWLQRFGKDGMWESFIHYPVRDWTPNGGGYINTCGVAN